jgi:hypothetical protein
MTVPKKPQPDDRDRPESAPGMPGSPFDEAELRADPADFEEDDEVGPQGGYGGTGPDQSRPGR